MLDEYADEYVMDVRDAIAKRFYSDGSCAAIAEQSTVDREALSKGFRSDCEATLQHCLGMTKR
jgi:DNA-binding phage protein